MPSSNCPRCGLSVTGRPHSNAEECLAHLAPRYVMAQRQLSALNRRFVSLEERLERAKIQERIARKEAKKNATIPARLERLEQLINERMEDIRAIA
jgi:hypothetical protein